MFQSNLINQIAEYVEMLPKTSQEQLLKKGLAIGKKN